MVGNIEDGREDEPGDKAVSCNGQSAEEGIIAASHGNVRDGVERHHGDNPAYPAGEKLNQRRGV